MIRFGIVGTGKITNEFLITSGLVDNMSLNAIYSRSGEKARSIAEKYNIEQVYNSLEEMAESKSIDAVYIASPNSLHASQAILFMRNKKHVLCEKPIASNLKELTLMIEEARKNRVLLMEAMKSTMLPSFKSIRDNLQRIGKVRRYFASYCQYSSRYDPYKEGENPNTFNPEFSSGALMDLGCYCIYPMVTLFGRPDSIKANGVMLDSGVDGEGSILLKYGEMDAVIMYSKITHSNLTSEIQGEAGNIIIDKISLPDRVSIAFRNGESEDISGRQIKEKMYYELQEFVNLIMDGKTESSTNTFDLSTKVMEIMDEVRRQIGLVYEADR